jgi:hypothetical protein
MTRPAPGSGSRSGLRHRPLRTVCETSASYGPSLPQRPSQDAVGPINYSLARGSAGDTWRAANPCCRTSIDHRNSARPDGGGARVALQPATVAGIPHTYHSVPSISNRSGSVPQECGPSSRHPCEQLSVFASFLAKTMLEIVAISSVFLRVRKKRRYCTNILPTFQLLTRVLDAPT